LVVERETTTTRAKTATAKCRLGCTPLYWLVDTFWGCAFGVGRPGERFQEGGRWLVVERETTTAGAKTATAKCHLGCTTLYWLIDTFWGCAFGVGRPGERVAAGRVRGGMWMWIWIQAAMTQGWGYLYIVKRIYNSVK
jgi:hypothetical protein